MLTPRLSTPDIQAALAETWAAGDVILRIPHVLRWSDAAAIYEELEDEDHSAEIDHDPQDGFQLWRHGFRAHSRCDHARCAFARWLDAEGRRFLERLTASSLAANPARAWVSDKHVKGNFFESYDDAAQGMALAVQLHLTPATWPTEMGGHLLCRSARSGAVSQVLAPAFNALDVFGLTQGPAWRELPVLKHHMDGYTLSAWYAAG